MVSGDISPKRKLLSARGTSINKNQKPIYSQDVYTAMPESVRIEVWRNYIYAKNKQWTQRTNINR